MLQRARSRFAHLDTTPRSAYDSHEQWQTDVMQRMHVGLKVSNIGEAVAFYSKLFGAEPDLLRSDYAKWMLDDPFVNFSVDLHGDDRRFRALRAPQLDRSRACVCLQAHR